jgi:hypothetical protein
MPSGILMSETPAMLFMALILLAVVRLVRRATPAAALLLGLACGAEALVRAELILFVPGLLLPAAALAFGGCDWTAFGYDPALTHGSADTAISGANVSTLKPLFTASGAFSSPVESGGVVYVGGQAGNLYAFDANGVTSCSGSPNQCNPLWKGVTGPVVNGTPCCEWRRLRHVGRDLDFGKHARRRPGLVRLCSLGVGGSR